MIERLTDKLIDRLINQSSSQYINQLKSINKSKDYSIDWCRSDGRFIYLFNVLFFGEFFFIFLAEEKNTEHLLELYKSIKAFLPE